MGNAEGILGDLQVHSGEGEGHEDWTVSPGELNGAPVTVFSASHPSTSRKRPYIEKALQASRIYRHPGLVKYIDGGIFGREVVIITERITPLHKDDLQHMSGLQITAGLSSLIETLVFLHDTAGVSHNNLSPTSLYLTAEGTWKLWGLEYSCRFGELNRDYIEHINSYCCEQFLPPDDKNRISPAYQHARDSYALGQLVDQVLAPYIDPDLPFATEFISYIQTMALHKDWAQRPRMVTLAEHSFFRHDFLKIHQDLTRVLLLSVSQRDSFLKTLAENLQKYPEELVAGTMAGALLSRPLLLIPAAATYLMPAVLTPRRDKSSTLEVGLFSIQVYEKYLLPHVINLFNIHDATIRGLLLTYLPHYVTLISKDILADDLLPELLLGIRDNNDELVAATLQALAHLVPILGANTVIGKHRKHLFTTAKPKSCVVSSYQKGKFNPNSAVERSRKDIILHSQGKNGTSVDLDTAMYHQSEAGVELCSLDDAVFDNMTALQIPERSSPDGGEDQDSNCNIQRPFSTEEDADAWSDWEEMHETQNPFISPPQMSTAVQWCKNSQPLAASLESTHPTEIKNILIMSERTFCDNGSSENFLKQGSAMKLDEWELKSKKKSAVEESMAKSRVSQGLGEEYDIMSIKVKKKKDSELDLFADIIPKFEAKKKYDLESLLVEAKRRSSGVSVAAALTDFDDGIKEGDGWATEEDYENEVFSDL